MNNPNKELIVQQALKIPPSAPNMKIGLFGGSFNPPHEGHRLVSRQMIKRLNLDALWWLITPGNPLKNNNNLAPLSERIIWANNLVKLPNIHISAFEAKYGFHYSYKTIYFLKNNLSDRKFVWIMGSDNLANFHLWERWDNIANLLPMAIYARPKTNISAKFSKFAIKYKDFRLDEGDAKLLPFCPAPKWVFLHGIMSDISSTKLRQNRLYIEQ